MSRDWTWTWEHYSELTPEQRAEISAEIAAESRRVVEEFNRSVLAATAAIREFGEAMTAAFAHPVASLNRRKPG